MLSPREIEKKAEKWWNDGSFLIAWLRNESFFPKEIPQIGVVKPSEVGQNFEKIYQEQQILKEYSKVGRGFGYQLFWKQINNKSIGNSGFITKISIETETDFVKLIDKEEKFDEFKYSVKLIKTQLPRLLDWVLENPLQVINQSDCWPNLLKISQYFLQNPMPHLYIRQLPIENLHTKFIENNKPIITSLLNFLLPSTSINAETTDFEKRFGLKESEPIIRFRILDNSLFVNNLSDISLPLSQLQDLYINSSLERIFIAENKMCILTFPEMGKSIIIFGSGKAVSNLEKLEWLQEKQVYYWGDLDVEGFEILSNLRKFKANAQSLMMDFECFDLFSKEGLVEGKDSVKKLPPNLTDDEIAMFQRLKTLPQKSNRLEQERIPQWYVNENLTKLRFATSK